MEEYVSIEQAAILLEANYTTVWRAINKGQYETRKRPSKKQAGKIVTDIRAASLPVQAQAKLMERESNLLKSTPLPASPHEKGGVKGNPLNPPCQGEADIKNSGTRSLVKSSASSLSLQDQATWYQSLSPEHLAIIEKRLSIIGSIKNTLDQSKEKNKAKLAIELAEENGIHRGTYYRWRKAYDTHNLYGLRVKRFGSTRSKLSEEQKNCILSLIKFNPDCRDIRVWEYLLDEFPQNMVSGSTVSRFLRSWKNENPDVFAHLSNPDSWKSNFQIAFGSQSEKAHHFLHFIELDSTPADVMCLDGKRYTIIGGIDIFSRKVKCFVSPSSSGLGVAALLRSIITDWGVPFWIVRDNGKDYICNQINLILQNLDIKAQTLKPFTPEGKPHIERFFRTLSMSLLEEAAGYVGHNVADRKAIEARRTFAQRLMKQGGEPVKVDLTPEDLQTLINRWIENIYHQKQHGGIRATPEHMAAQSSVPVRRVEDERALDILLLPCGTRVIGKKGIAFENAFYRSPQFAGWVGKEVRVRRDMDNAGLLYVFDLENNFICTAMDSRIDGMTSAEYQAANKEQKRIVREKVKAIDTLTESPMMRRLNKSQAGKKLVGLSRTQTHSTEALEQAGNAALVRNGIKPEKYKTVAEQMRDREFDSNEIEFDDDPLAFMDRIKIVNE